jgi:hypothetical protein
MCWKEHPLKGLKWGFSGENSASENGKLTIPTKRDGEAGKGMPDLPIVLSKSGKTVPLR